jgi:integrase
LANGPKLTRTGSPAKIKPEASENPEDEKERIRKRRARANRILTPLRAALNYAVRNKHLSSDTAWRVSLKAYAEVDGPTIRYLNMDECDRLKEAAEPDFSRLITGALATGCRYGSLRFIRARDVDLRARTALAKITKNGKPHIIRLNQSGCRFLASILRNKTPTDLLFAKSSGEPWKPSDQIRRMKKACDLAGIVPEINFHGLRDTFASRLVMRGTSLLAISKLLGHADVRTTEKYYAHLAPDYLHDVIDNNLPDFV